MDTDIHPNTVILHAAAIVPGRIAGPNAVLPPLIAAQNRLPGVRAALIVTKGPGAEALEADIPAFDCWSMFGRDGRLRKRER